MTNEPTGPVALVSSPGHTRGLNSRRIIEEVLAEAGFSVFQDPGHELPYYESVRNRSEPTEYLLQSPSKASRERRIQRAQALRRTALVVVDFTHDERRAGESLESFRTLGSEPRATLALSPIEEGLRFPDDVCHIAYQSRPDLVRRLRSYLGLSQPLPGGQLGYGMVFQAPEATYGLLELLLPRALLSAFRELRFSGRCECYLQDQSIPGTCYTMVLGLATRETTGALHKKRQWWWHLLDELHRGTQAQNADIRFFENLSDFARVRTMREKATLQGSADFYAGTPRRLIRALDARHWFERLVSADLRDAPSLPEHPRE